MPAWLHAEPPTLTQDEAVAAALAHARQLPANAARTRALQEQATAAGQRPDPVLRLALESLPVNGPEAWSTTRDFMTMRSIGVMQTLPSQAKRHARHARLSAEAGALLSQSDTLVSDIQRATADAWLEARAANQRLGVLRARRDEALREAQAAQAAVRGGRAAAAEGLHAQDRIWQLEEQWAQAQADAAASLDTLARWTGMQAQPKAEPYPHTDATTPAAIVSELLAQHPALKNLQAQQRAAEAAATLADAERRPDWTWELMLSQRGPLYSDMVTLGVSVPLTWNRAQRQDRELAAALATADALSEELLEAERVLKLQLQDWLHRERAATQRLKIIDTQRLPLAQQRVQALLASYRSGNTTLTDVLAARQQALGLQLQRIDTELEAARMRAQLNYLLPRQSPAQAATAQEKQP